MLATTHGLPFCPPRSRSRASSRLSRVRLLLPAARNILPFMAKEFEFFITESPDTVRQWAMEKKESGAILVGSSDGVLEQLLAKTGYHEPVSVCLSGAWLDQCVQKGVRALLSLKNNPDSFQQPAVMGVQVDLSTCFAYDETKEALSIDARRQLLLSLIGIHAQDPRLTLLPTLPAH